MITKILCVGSIPFISIVVELLLLHAEQYYPLGSKPTNPNTEGLRAWVNLIPFGQVLSKMVEGIRGQAPDSEGGSDFEGVGGI